MKDRPDEFIHDAANGRTIHIPHNRLLRIDSLYAFLSVDAEGNEGVCGYYEPRVGGMMAMVAADEARLAELRLVAAELVAGVQGRMGVRLVRFTSREEVEGWG